jgi:hypothetical protein
MAAGRSRSLAAPALMAAALLGGCSSDRLSQRETYTTAAVAPPVARPQAVTAPAPAAPAPVAAPHAARPAPQPATTAPASTPPPAPVPQRPARTPTPAQQVQESPPPNPAATKHAPTGAAGVGGHSKPDPQGDPHARSTVLRFHRLLDAHDPSACDLLVSTYRQTVYGGNATTSLERCRSKVSALTTSVTGVVELSGADAAGRWVQVLTTIGDQSFRQVMHLIPANGGWLIDGAHPGAA